MSSPETFRYCRKCLLRDMKESEYFESLHSYIQKLEDDLKVSPEIYENRLGQCRECDQLLSGMCRICGCYVELRAAMKKNRCPKVSPSWTEEICPDRKGMF